MINVQSYNRSNLSLMQHCKRVNVSFINVHTISRARHAKRATISDRSNSFLNCTAIECRYRVSLHKEKRKRKNGMRVMKRVTRESSNTEHIARANRSREIVERSNVGDGPRIVFVYLGQCRPAMNKQQRSFFETI